MTLLEFIKKFKNDETTPIINCITEAYNYIFEGITDINHINLATHLYNNICTNISNMNGNSLESDDITINIDSGFITPNDSGKYINVVTDKVCILFYHSTTKMSTEYISSTNYIYMFIKELHDLQSMSHKDIGSILLRYKPEFIHEYRHLLDNNHSKAHGYNHRNHLHVPKSHQYDTNSNTTYFNNNTEYNAWLLQYIDIASDILKTNQSLSKKEFIQLLTDNIGKSESSHFFKSLTPKNQRNALKRFTYVWDHYNDNKIK